MSDVVTTLAESRINRRAQDFYATYCAASGGLNFQGHPCPPWLKLPESVRDNWRVVALRSAQLDLVDHADEDEKRVGLEADILPSSAVIGHLGDDARVEQAIETWTKYSVYSDGR